MYVIDGYVYDAVTKKPIFGAKVKFRDWEATTGPTGYYKIELPVGYSDFLEVSASGYIKAQIPVTTIGHQRVDVYLTPIHANKYILEIVVKDSSTYRRLSGVRIKFKGITKYTDENGHALIEFNEPVSGNLIAEKSGYKRYVTYVRVTAVGTNPLEIYLEKKETTRRYILDGYVYDKDSGDPITNAIVSFGGITARTDELGYFYIETTQDSGYVKVEKEGYKTFTKYIKLSGMLTTINIYLEKGVSAVIPEINPLLALGVGILALIFMMKEKG